MRLTADQILTGASTDHEVAVPPELLAGGGGEASLVKLRPLTVRDLQRIERASRDDESLSASLMIQLALVDPQLSHEQVAQLPAGMAQFLVTRINEISGVNTGRDALDEMVQAPLARACFTLAKEFGWTPEEVSGMTIGQILLYLEMVRRKGEAA